MEIIGHDRAKAHFEKLAAARDLRHGYIFFGPAQVGKKSFALALANFLENGRFDLAGEGRVFQDARLIAPDGEGSLGIDAVREARDFLWQKPVVSSRRLLIADEAERLTAEAQNALLKITEEPPPSGVVILATSDVESLLPTLRSRFHEIYFGAVPEKELGRWIENRRGGKPKNLGQVLAQSFGAPGRAADLMEGNKEKLRTDAAKVFGAASNRSALLKDLIAEESFRFLPFLDECIAHELMQGALRLNRVRWHRLLRIREAAASYNLNPRIQLEYIFS